MTLSSASASVSSTSTTREPSPSLALPLPAAPLPGSPTDSLAASPGSVTSPNDSNEAAPTWPAPASIALSAYRPPLHGRHSSGAVVNKPKRPLLTGFIPRSTRFEVSLVDRLSEVLEGELDSIWEASGAVKVELKGEKGRRRLVATGSSSAVTKARQLVDAKLSQTPIRVLLAIRFAHSDAATLQFIPSPHPPLGSPPFPIPHRQLYRAKESAPASLNPVALAEALAPHAALSPGGSDTEGSTPGAQTDSSESSTGFFTAQSRSTSRHSLLGAPASSLPAIGSYCFNRQGYIDAVVDELETCVERRSLVRLKMNPGSSFWCAPKDGKFSLAAEGKSWCIEEIQGWKIDEPNKSLSSHFSIALSPTRAEEFRHVLVEKFGLELSHETSHVHVQHLDRRRAVYASATSELRGSEIKGIGPGVSASGTLNLKKVSTLPSKPFFLSITSPVCQGAEEPSEGNDLRIKVLSDKAATSPSLELSQSFNAASWDLDGATGRFEVHLTLDPDRFSASQTVIRYMAKSRFENEHFRATLIEIRQHQTSSHYYELEFTHKKLNGLLATTAQSQRKRQLDRDEVALLVSELIGFCEKVVSASAARDGEEGGGDETDGDGTPQGTKEGAEKQAEV